ncbi:hypothetical protein HRW23_17390 [Streptomyces lunaelactis]|uniref:hypothetical protein n=1 Tax=Streptomyces lunaelactis TaxID=1535768 RepID=UPI001585A69C|nr:hypothetical protein [Streptomyces lunaelactis]NUK04605.1 hypothetical protein [Streptomyces lunaelactis]NUK09303.1 hypothetical protein [Streptomyces lunaelactis]NUK18975.1 hypothetical protein [Streptomyces lunaelactis]NUK26403.1 hypothetical protein [Streptomyces lunaelactis]NUK34727.1 hypothetical protein [Streptomyces lunaelactis]
MFVSHAAPHARRSFAEPARLSATVLLALGAFALNGAEPTAPAPVATVAAGAVDSTSTASTGRSFIWG